MISVSWSPLFRDLVLSTNSWKSTPFRDFESKKKKGNFFGIFFLVWCFVIVLFHILICIWTLKFLFNLLHESCHDKFQQSTFFSTHYCSHRDRLIYPHCSTHIASILKGTIDLIPPSEDPKSVCFYIPTSATWLLHCLPACLPAMLQCSIPCWAIHDQLNRHQGVLSKS